MKKMQNNENKILNLIRNYKYEHALNVKKHAFAYMNILFCFFDLKIRKLSFNFKCFEHETRRFKKRTLNKTRRKTYKL